tara:strand:+ start:1018 stop:1752 length:735 start_codon:yes stop_codon:yes gene_type:complete
MKKELISVVIPSFNRLDYLIKAIESVLNQTYKNIEIIVINDGSSEIGYLEHKYVKDVVQINLDENQKKIHGFGPGNIRNFGIDKAKGEWLAFLDDDDYWLKDKIEKQLDVLNTNNSLMCSTDAYIGEGFYDESIDYPSFLNEYYYEDNKKYLYRNYFISKYKKLTYPKYFDSNYITTFNPIITSSVVVKKELVKKLGGFRNLPENADYDLWRAVLQFTKCFLINNPLVYYDNKHGYGREYKKIK